MKTRRYQSIKAWQLADDLAVSIYEVTKTFPTEERYGLVSQMRRGSVSVAANIVEGSSRSSWKEYLQFLSVSRGSLAELRYFLHLSKRLGYLKEEKCLQLDELCDEVARVSYGLMKAIERGVSPVHHAHSEVVVV